MTSGMRSAIVNQEFARQFLGAGPAAGVRLGPLYEGQSAAETEIIGVVGDVLKDGNDAERQPEMYFAHGSRTHRITGFPTVVVRGPADAADLAPSCGGMCGRFRGRGHRQRGATPDAGAASWAQPRFAASVCRASRAGNGARRIGLYARCRTESRRPAGTGLRGAMGATRAR